MNADLREQAMTSTAKIEAVARAILDNAVRENGACMEDDWDLLEDEDRDGFRRDAEAAILRADAWDAEHSGQGAAFEQECADVDALLRHLALDPERCRTEGGCLNLPRIKSLLRDSTDELIRRVDVVATNTGTAADKGDVHKEYARGFDAAVETVKRVFAAASETPQAGERDTEITELERRLYVAENMVETIDVATAALALLRRLAEQGKGR